LFVSSLEPFKVEEALDDPDWVMAMQEELNNFIWNEVWSFGRTAWIIPVHVRRPSLYKRQDLIALQTEQLIGLSGHRSIEPRLHRIDIGLPRTKASPALQQLTTFTRQDN
jgi:hypothetical protein